MTSKAIGMRVNNVCQMVQWRTEGREGKINEAIPGVKALSWIELLSPGVLKLPSHFQSGMCPSRWWLGRRRTSQNPGPAALLRSSGMCVCGTWLVATTVSGSSQNTFGAYLCSALNIVPALALGWGLGVPTRGVHGSQRGPDKPHHPCPAIVPWACFRLACPAGPNSSPKHNVTDSC